MRRALLLTVPVNAAIQNAAELILEPVAPLERPLQMPPGKNYDKNTQLIDLLDVVEAVGITYKIVKAISDAKKAKRPSRDLNQVDTGALRNRLTDAVSHLCEVIDVLEKQVRKARKSGIEDDLIQSTLDALGRCWSELADISTFLGEDVQTLQARSVA